MDLIGKITCNKNFDWLINFLYLEHSTALDVDKMNREKIDADCNLWDALESSKWLPFDVLEVVWH